MNSYSFILIVFFCIATDAHFRSFIICHCIVKLVSVDLVMAVLDKWPCTVIQERNVTLKYLELKLRSPAFSS